MGLLRKLEEDTSLNKLLPMLSLSSQINAFSLFFHMVFRQNIGMPMGIDQKHYFGPTSFFIFNLSI